MDLLEKNNQTVSFDSKLFETFVFLAVTAAHRQYSEPIKTLSKYKHVAEVKGGKIVESESRLALVSLLIGLTKWREFFEPIA